MPKILELGRGKITVHIYCQDHMPPHVHVRAPGAEAKFDIAALVWLESRGFSRKALGRIQQFLEARLDYLKEQWDDYQA